MTDVAKIYRHATTGEILHFDGLQLRNLDQYDKSYLLTKEGRGAYSKS